VVSGWELEQHELALLREATRTVDVLDKLHAIVEAEGPVVDGGKAGPKVHPALTDARQLRVTMARVLAALRLPDGDEGDSPRAAVSGAPPRVASIGSVPREAPSARGGDDGEAGGGTAAELLRHPGRGVAPPDWCVREPSPPQPPPEAQIRAWRGVKAWRLWKQAQQAAGHGRRSDTHQT